MIAPFADGIGLQQKGFSSKFGGELLRIIDNARRAALWPLSPPSLMSKIFSWRWLDGRLVRISPRDRVALQHAHLRSGVRLIARNRSGRRDQSGGPMAGIPEG